MKKPYTRRDGEVRDLDKEFFETARRGRPSLSDEAKKQRVNVMLDPDVAAHLREVPNASAYVNEMLRKKMSAAARKAGR